MLYVDARGYLSAGLRLIEGYMGVTRCPPLSDEALRFFLQTSGDVNSLKRDATLSEKFSLTSLFEGTQYRLLLLAEIALYKLVMRSDKRGYGCG